MPQPLIAITGASSGIGAALAQAFAKAGHPLLLMARRIDRLEALDLPDTVCSAVDVTDRVGLKRAVAQAEATYGPVDCLVNNAGVMLLGQLQDQNPEEWRQMVDVNILGVMNGIQAVLGDMMARRMGTIVNISSVAGRKTFANHAAYCATKFAVHALTENAREEAAARNVRFITVAPGAVETELLGHTTSGHIKDSYESWKKGMGGALAAEDVARAVLFAYQQPQGVCLREIVLAATRQGP